MNPDAVRAIYRLCVTGTAAEQRAHALALEQSIEMPSEAVTDARVLRDVVARVESLAAQPDGSTLATLLLSTESIANDAGQLMNMLFGNSSLLDDVEVVAVTVPDALAARFGGPALGIEGLRRLTGASGPGAELHGAQADRLDRGRSRADDGGIRAGRDRHHQGRSRMGGTRPRLVRRARGGLPA